MTHQTPPPVAALALAATAGTGATGLTAFFTDSGAAALAVALPGLVLILAAWLWCVSYYRR